MKNSVTGGSRRDFLALVAASLGCGERLIDGNQPPVFLAGHATTYSRDPRAAGLAWFEQACSGLSFQYGVYSQLGPDPWVRFHEGVSAADYDQLKESFTAERFNADDLVALARETGADYIRFPARLWDGFSLFRTNETSFTSLSSPAGRDLVGEMTDACRRAGIGLFLEYAYGLDWRHPYFYPADSVQLEWRQIHLPNNEGAIRRFEKDEDFLEYIKYAHVQLKEILYRYAPLAGIALTPVMGYYARPDLFPLPTAYDIIHEAEPHVLLSFEQGANGQEDFVSLRGDVETQGGETAEQVRRLNAGKPVELLAHVEATRGSVTPGKREASGRNLVYEVQLKPDGSVPEAAREQLLRAR